MEKKRIYPNKWQSVPFSFDLLNQVENRDKAVKELILKSEAATELHVSDMMLNITQFSAFDAAGNEHTVADFPGQSAVTLRGISSGQFLRSKNVVSLPEGTYTKLRFYLANEGNQFRYWDGVQESADHFGRLDFIIENGLQIEGNEGPEVKLWFDFVPYKWSSHFKPFLDLFKGNKTPRPRLANSFGN
ncbi:hypothetical protein J0X14_11535 [Muricauda sp. CAU 1633]|uniref:hypothetical protein n=1 Tax=Allomuricauda sp. CAU 1633 TaxID=2816036 RepID=UPI001A8D56E4|nr:hypothetical protein [Muricauda sp. CAU 1633]MBO0322929.1 hypothetical protein [Muricauda sp. CAU 1633]